MTNEQIARELLKTAKSLLAYGEDGNFDEDDALDPASLKTMDLSDIAGLIRRDWKNVNFAAKPYLSAMQSLRSIRDDYGMDRGTQIVAYFLSNARSLNGPVAKLVKKELNRRLR